MKTRMSGTSIPTLFAIPLLLIAATAWAKPQVEIGITATKEVVETRNGAKATKVVPADKAVPGDLVTYTLTYTNKGDEAATDAVITDPIPEGTTYIANSASGDGAELTFSNDGGKTYAPATKLTYEIRLPNGKTEKRVATPNEYTNVRWVIRQIPAGATGKVSFQVKVN